MYRSIAVELMSEFDLVLLACFVCVRATRSNVDLIIWYSCCVSTLPAHTRVFQSC